MFNWNALARLLWFGLLLLSVASVQAEVLPYVKVREPSNLQAVGQEAQQRQLPIMIMFSREGCPYCDVVREEFLKPMLRSGDYTDRVIMLEIHSDSYAQLRDFNGQMIGAEALAHRYRAGFAPTVVFLNHQGKELAERLIGITTRDFYGGFLDESIEKSLQRVRSIAMNGTD
ncbi:MAG: thioredoxin fold domain-containing protein [Gammaproteobacteria bacterium]|nr:thioredoxin fold domain-containing protein [Gammaproteobacteria bacterium]